MEFGDAGGAVACRDVNQDSRAGTGVLGGVVMVDQGNPGLLRRERQGVGHQRVAAPGQHHRADVVVGRARQPGDLQAGADDAEIKGGVVGGEDVIANEGTDLREQLSKAWQPGNLLGPDTVDPDVVVIEPVVVLRRAHQPGGLFDHHAAAYFRQANGARRTAEAVGGLKVDRRKIQTHAPTLPSRPAHGGIGRRSRPGVRRRRSSTLNW